MKLTLITICAAICIFTNSYNQTVFNTGRILIAENTEINIEGGIENSGLLSNAGYVHCNGNWINNGEYVDNNSIVILNGKETQIVDHNNYSFGTLLIEGGDKIIKSNFTVSDELQLNHGLIIPEPDVEIRISENAEITNASEYSFVNGSLIHEGTGYKFFPIGKNRNYLPAELHDLQGNSPVVKLEVFEPNPAPGIVEGLLWVSERRYWQKTIVSGSVESALITLYYQDENPVTIPDNLVVAESSSENRVFSSLGSTNYGASNIQSSITGQDVISEDIFAIAELNDFISICNVITPNNDNVNDYLYIANIEEYPENEVVVLNRMGDKVYSAVSYQNDWDTSIDGKKLPNGNYVCIVKIEGYPNTFRQMITILN